MLSWSTEFLVFIRFLVFLKIFFNEVMAKLTESPIMLDLCQAKGILLYVKSFLIFDTEQRSYLRSFPFLRMYDNTGDKNYLGKYNLK